jgi:hypothetical protein
MTIVKDLRTPEPDTVSFRSLEVGQAYEDTMGNVCLKTSNLDEGVNCMYYTFSSQKWHSETESLEEKVVPLNIEINVLP